MAYSLSEFLITAVVLYCRSTLAQDFCGHIGDDNDTQLEADMREMFYLDTDNPACCTGNVTTWTVCYYGPGNSAADKAYHVRYAVYRRNKTDPDSFFQAVPHLIFNTTLRDNDRQMRRHRSSHDHDTPQYDQLNITRGLHCHNQSLDAPFTVQEGDVIGACVVNPMGGMRQLKVVGKITDHGHIRLYAGTKNLCRQTFPLIITTNELSAVNLTRLHLSAKIRGFATTTASEAPTTASEAPTTNEITEQIPVPSYTTSMNVLTTFQNTVPVTATTELTVTETSFSAPSSTNGTNGDSLAQEQERRALEAIMNSGRLNRVLDLIQNATDDLLLLECLRESAIGAVREREVNLSVPVYLLSATVNRFERRRVNSTVTELFLRVSNSLLEIAQTDRESRLESLEPPLGIAGSTLLQVIDRFALDNHNISHPVINLSENIVFHVEEVSLDDTTEKISPIEGEIAELNIPREVLESAAERGASVRMASFLFRNMSGLLPQSLNDGVQNDTNQQDRVLRLASPVISASFQCDNCTTSNLSTPVEITFTHLSYDKALLENDCNGTTTCVFWEFEDIERQGSILYAGQWSTNGCETRFTSDSTVCRCNHLTHFAILLSAQPLDLSQPQILALQITGYIGVSISLVAMAATIFVFVFLKPLRTMRNYIHIQLCVTLGIAQIIFVAGAEPHLGEGSGVPISCRSVAVLLHYWFLVSFMWMLMEGVVLYVALVRVFIKFYGRYIAAFTIASYGLPLLYVGALTVPLDFVRTDIYRQYHSYDYGYEQACYLNPDTSFVWSLIAPVILIFLANIGFFIMAIVIMYKHQKRQGIDDKKHKVKHWTKASISLTVVMGITWIIGLLVIEVEELFALAYIFTIFVAFQGLFIFVIFVLLSKQVRENYAKWWKAKVAESDFLSKHFGTKILTSGTGLSAQNNNIPLPAAHGKTNGESSRSDSGISSKVFENSSGEQRLAMGSYCDLKSESYFINDNVKESDTAVPDKHSNQANKSSKV